MTDEPDKVALETPDLAGRNRAAFDELFPGVAADGVLDAAKLGELLGLDVALVNEGRERYGLQWAGKQDAVRSLLTPGRGTLVPDLERSIDFDNAKNVFIEGDNLEVLKLLQKGYNDSFDAIYIDPPYNVDAQGFYNDDFSDSLTAYLKYTGQLDADGNRVSSSIDSVGRKHSRWLSMLAPRLVLARNLLKQDGVIFVSIDDSELANLIRLLDEYFGEENQVAVLAVELSKTQGMKVSAAQSGQLVKNHEYVLVYARNLQYAYAGRVPLFDASEVYDDHYDIVWDGEGGARNLFEVLKEDITSAATFSKYGFKFNKRDLYKALDLDEGFHSYFIETFGSVLYRTSPISLGAIQELKLNPGEIVRHAKYILRANGKGTIEQLQAFNDGVRQTDDHTSTRHRATIRGAMWKGFFSDMMNVAKEGGVEFKNGKKPVRLMQQLLKWTGRPDGLFLDFFAGSGSTGHSVARLNSSDGGSRRFVLVQLPEPTADGRVISDMTLSRLQNLGLEYPEQAALRVYSLSSSNFRPAVAVEGELELTPHTLRPGVDDLYAVAAEVLLKEGVPLDAPWVKYDLVNVSAQVSGGVGVVIGKGLDMATAEKVLALDPQPRVVVFLEDDLAGRDALKANLVANAKARGITLKTV